MLDNERWKQMNSVGIVIVNYNGAAYQNDCIRTLYEQTYQKFEIIVVDSASSDDSIKLLKKEYPKVYILEQSTNVGVAAGNNIGIKYSKKLGMDYTLLLNNDVELHKNVLKNLMNRVNENTIVVPKIYYYEPDDLLWFAGGELDWRRGGSYHIGINCKDKDQYNMEREITYAPTCCMLIHNSIFDKIGYIYEPYFMYYDDTDFCAKINENDQLKILYVPDAYMWHKVSSSTGGGTSKLKIYYQTRNKLLYMERYRKYIKRTNIIWTYFVCGLRYLKGLLFNSNNKIIIKALKDYKNGEFGKQNI